MKLLTKSVPSGSSPQMPSGSDQGGYDPEFYPALYAAEDRHFWFQARNQVIETVAGRIASSMTARPYVLEIGCGDGNTTRYLQRACADGTVIGMDLFAEGLRYARMRGIRLLVQGDASRSPFRVHFDMIGMFDVIEHIADDIALLRDLRLLIRDGGRLMISVPAHPSLWSYFDEAAHHCRRYELGDLCERLENAGYEVEYATEFMTSIYPFVWLQRRWARLTKTHKATASEMAKRDLRVNWAFNLILRTALALEIPWIRRRKRLPIGTSILAIARKRP